MYPTNITQLDFNDIRESIISYLRTRPEFSDYQFTGSTLSYLIDILAYNTYYSAFTANMTVNESFLNSATVRDNIVKHAKVLNYTPTSISASTLDITLKVQTTAVNGIYPSTCTARRGFAGFSGDYAMNLINDTTAVVDPTTGVADFGQVSLKEGTVITFSYVVNTFARQVYQIPTPDADISTLKVFVKANESTVTADVYNLAENITALTATDRVYFLSEGNDQRYEVQFGDDISGRKLKDGEVIVFEYVVTNGAEGNDSNLIDFNGRIVDSNGRSYTKADITTSVVQPSYGGGDAESVESIKYNAPRYYSAQYRAVTAEDYATITRKIYSNADSVVAYGGDLLNPPIYGKVFIAIKTKTGSTLNDATKKNLSNDLRRYAMASIDPVIIDPDVQYVYPKTFVQYNTACGENASQIKDSIQTAISQWQEQSGINAFNSVFRAQQYKKAIMLANKCVVDVSMQVSVIKYINPNSGETNTYTITTNTHLYNSAPSFTKEVNTFKEPVLLSGKFRTEDRPGIDQQFEDDGFGRLRIFYNTGTKKVYTNDSAGTVNYETGTINFGPISIIGTGGNLPQAGAVSVSDATTGAGRVIDRSLLPTSLQIPVQIIPADISAIPAATPATSLNIISPDVTVQPLGSETPPTIPLNSLTPTTFDQTETIINIDSISNGGSLNS